MSKKGRLEVQGRMVEVPLVIGSENEVGLDISNLRKETGWRKWYIEIPGLSH